jgi:hypothetical protein
MDGLTWARCQWDRVAGWALVAVAVTLVAVAAGQARTTLFAADGLSYLMSGGVGGLAIGAFGCALLISAGFHDEWRKLNRVDKALRARRTGRSTEANGAASTTSAGPATQAGLMAQLRSQGDRVVGWTLVAASGAWLAVGYHNVAQSIYPPEQVAYLISGGLVGLVILCAGATLLLIADWKDDGLKLDRIAAALAGDDPATSGAPKLTPAALGGGVAALIGAALMAAGWAKAADAVQLHPAMNGLAVATGGLGLILLALSGVAFWLRRSLVRRMTSLLSSLASAKAQHEVVLEREPVHLDLTDFWTAEGLRRYHRADCPALVSARGERRLVEPNSTDQEPCLLCEV